MLRVDKHALDDALETQAVIQEEISEHLSRASTRVQAAKDDLARCEARLFSEIKEDFPKMSVEVAKAEVQVVPERITAWKLHQTLREEHEQWLGLHDAWKGRGYSMSKLTDLYLGQYFSINSAGGATRRTTEQASDAGRKALREASRTSEAARAVEGGGTRRRIGS